MHFERKNAELFYRRADAHAGYHEIRAKAGITEPVRIDPLGGVAAVARVMQSLGLNHDKTYLSERVKRTGEGSTLADIAESAPRLGLTAHYLNLDKQSLPAMLKLGNGVPIIAWVEHDHMVAVKAADKSGVTYLCLDCGPWPGGLREVTWDQWQLMEAIAYLALTPFKKPLSEALLRHSGKLHAESLPDPAINNLVASLAVASVAYLQYAPGFRPPSNQCECPGEAFCPIDSSVLVSNGQAQPWFKVPTSVSNPSGPSVDYSPQYFSNTSMASEFGEGWSHAYNVGVSAYITEGGGNHYINGHVVEKNGSRFQFTYEGANEPSSTNPSLACTVTDSAYSVKVNWIWDATAGSDRFEVIFKNRNKWISAPGNGDEYDHQPGAPINVSPDGPGNPFYRPIQKMVDRVGQWIELVHAPYQARDDNWGDEPRLTHIKDASGTALITNTLDSDGYLISTLDRYGRKTIYTVAAPDSEWVQNGPQYLRALSAISQPVASSATAGPAAYQFNYDQHHNGVSHGGNQEQIPYLISSSTPSPTGTGMATTTYNYVDVSGMAVLESVTDPNGNVKTFTETGTNEITVEQEDDSNNVVSRYIVEYNGDNQTTKVCDENGDPVVEYTFGGNLLPTTIRKHYDGSTFRDWTFEYDSMNNVIWSMTPKGEAASPDLGTKSTYSYTNWWGGELVEVQQGTGSCSSFTATRAKTTYTYYSANGLLNTTSTPPPGSTSTTPTLQTTTYTYNSLGDILTIVSPGNNAESTHTTTFNYTTDGSYSQSAKTGQPLTVQNSAGEKTHFRYDSRGNMTETWDNLGNTSEFTYNNAVQKLTSELPATGSTGSGNATTLNTYMWLGGPVSQANSYSEAGGSAFRTVNFTYGQSGEMLTRTGSTEPVTLTYDAAYRTETVTDGAGSGHTTDYEYNLNGRLTEIDNPMASSTNFDQVHFTSYDRQGNLLSRTDGRGFVTSYVYGDGDGNLTEVNYTSASSENVDIVYDDYGRVIETSNGTSVEEITYDQADFVTSRDTTYSGMTGTKTIDYTYYPDGSRASLTHPGDSWNYEYDEAGRNVSLDSSAMGESTFEYMGNGWMEKRNLPNGSYTNYQYNQVGMLSWLENNNSVDATHSYFMDFIYDGVFNLTKVTNRVENVVDMNGDVEFTYDTKDRLTNETSARYGGYTETQVYDGAGNPTTFRSSSGKTYSNANQRSNGSFTFDGNGNPTTWDGKSASYDRENRLTNFGASPTTMGYRPDNLRAWRKYGTEPKTYFLYDSGSVICELEPDGDVIAHNVFAPDGLVGREENSELNYYMFDQQGNVVHLLNENEEETVHFAYNAWGSRNYAFPEGAHKLTQPFSYNGKWGYYRDAGTELYYCQNRYYDPENGRWLNRDPIGFAGGVNKYGYCGASPVTNIDPLGLAVFLCFEAVDDGQGGPGSKAGKMGAKHWFAMAGCDRSSGWAPTGNTAGYGDLTQGHFMPDGVSVLYGPPQRPDSRCILLPATKEQEECICEALKNFHNAKAGGLAPPTLGGQQWTPNGQAGGYRFGYHNCQDFSKTLLERCGISVPVATQTSWITPLVEHSPLGPIGRALPF